MAEVVGSRLKRLIEDQRTSQSAVARELGVSQPTIGRLISGETPETGKLLELARLLHCTPEYLVGESDNPTDGFVPPPSTATVANELGLVPVREIDLNLGMGETFLDVPVTETVRHFPREWLRLYTRADPEHLVFAQGVGDSMEPTLRDSDLMLIDCSQRHLNTSDKIWAIAYGQCGSVKRLRPLPDGGVAILSDNPNVPDTVAYDGELHLLGRIVAVVRKM